MEMVRLLLFRLYTCAFPPSTTDPCQAKAEQKEGRNAKAGERKDVSERKGEGEREKRGEKE